MGVLFDNLTISEGRMPTMAELDQVSTDHPIWVLHASGHNGVANSICFQSARHNATDARPFWRPGITVTLKQENSPV